MKQITTTLFLVLFSLSMGQVGISKSNDFRPNTNVEGDIVNSDTSPVMLDVDGKTRVRTMPVAKPNTYSPVVRNNTTGVLEILSDLNNSNKPFNVTTYTLQNVNQDWVWDFNTKVPADKWTVAVTGFRFKNKNTENAFIVTNRDAIKKDLENYYNSANEDHWIDYSEHYDVSAAPSVFAYKRNGTWRLQADFPGSGTNGRINGVNYPLFENGSWYIDVMIIENSFVNILGSNNTTVNMGGEEDGTAPSSPVGQ